MVLTEWPGDDTPSTIEALDDLLAQGYGLRLYGVYYYLHHGRLQTDSLADVEDLLENLAECRRCFAVDDKALDLDAFHRAVVSKYAQTDQGWGDETASESDDEVHDPSYDECMSPRQVDCSLRRYAQSLYSIPSAHCDEMTTCEKCGNVWDGASQCDCWRWHSEMLDDS